LGAATASGTHSPADAPFKRESERGDMEEKPETSRPDYDSPWKEAIGAYFEPFMRLFFPSVHAIIDWSRPYELLDAELRKITGDSTLGRRYADRLVKVFTLEDAEVWLLIHVEVQGKADEAFNFRMFVYYYRIRDRFEDVEIVSLAVVTDEPDVSGLGVYEEGRDGYGLRFTFRVYDLQRWRDRERELKVLAADNPFAVVALAQLEAHRKSTDPERKARKREIVWLLYEHGYSRDDVLNLLRFIDWMIRLPPKLDMELRDELIAYEEEMKVPYVTSFERMAREEGEKIGEKRGEKRGEVKGLAKALLKQLRIKFGPPQPEWEKRILAATPEQLDLWVERILAADRPEDLFL